MYASPAGAAGSIAPPGRVSAAELSASCHSPPGASGSTVTTRLSRAGPVEPPAWSAVARSHSHSAAPESARMWAFSGGASARLTPTQTAPRRMAPWKAITTSASLGSDAATRSPARTPKPRSVWAARFASRSSSA